MILIIFLHGGKDFRMCHEHLHGNLRAQLLPALLITVHAKIEITPGGHGGKEHGGGALALGFRQQRTHGGRSIEQHVAGGEAMNLISRLHQLFFSVK